MTQTDVAVIFNDSRKYVVPTACQVATHSLLFQRPRKLSRRARCRTAHPKAAGSWAVDPLQQPFLQGAGDAGPTRGRGERELRAAPPPEEGGGS